MISLRQLFSEKLHYLILIVFALIYCSISLVNHYNFRTYGLDLGLYNNAIYSYSHFQRNNYPLLHFLFPNMLADHFELIPFIVSPLYWIFGSYTMLVVQIAVILFGGYGIYVYFLRRTGNSVFSSVAMFHFFSVWGIVSALAFDFHCNVVAAMLVPWFIYYFDKNELRKSLFFFILILISKENMALWAVFIALGLCLISIKDKARLKFAAILCLLAFLYFALVMKVIMPWLNDNPEKGYFHFKYKALGANGSEALKTILHRPIYVFKLFFYTHLPDHAHTYGVKKETWKMFLLSGGFLIIFRPHYIIMLIPIFAQKMLSDDFEKWGISNQYSIEFVPILTLCAFEALSKLKSNTLLIPGASVVALLSLHSNYQKLKHRVSPWFPYIQADFLSRPHYKCAIDRKTIMEAIDKIPEGAKVSAATPIVPHICDRKYIYMIPDNYFADYILMVSDERSFSYPLSVATITQQIDDLKRNTAWTCEFEKNQVYLFKRIH